MTHGLAEYALLFKVLSDETRLSILTMLNSKEELCACKLLENLQITQPTLSYHMKVLTENELVFARKDGSWMRYKLNPQRLAQLTAFLTEVEE